MQKVLLTGLTMLLVTLAGCTDSEDPEPQEATLEEQCAALGFEVVMDEMTGEERCGTAAPKIDIQLAVDGLGVTAYKPFTYSWTLFTTAEESHTMRTEVRFAMESADSSTLTGGDSFGNRMTLFEHQNFKDGRQLDGEFMFEEPGTYYMRAFALVSGENYWTEEYVLTVGDVEPTGVTHEITIAPGGPLGGPNVTDLKITIGDAVVFVNENPLLDLSIEATNPAGAFSTSAPAGGSSEPLLIFSTGTYTYEASNDVDSSSGTIAVSAPLPEA